MPNYNDGKIYKIVCNITDECYVGSTCEPTLARRLATHVSNYKSFLKSNKKKCTSVDIIRRGDYKILLIESFPCNSKDELASREGEIIRQYKLECECVNKNIAGRTRQQYYEDNKDKNLDLMKQYYKDNKENFKKYREDNKDKMKQ